MRLALLSLTFLSLLSMQCQVTFQNVSDSTGFTYQGRSWGSSWGDINGDGLMDLFLSCHEHQFEPYFENDTLQIFINMGGTFFDENVYSLLDAEQSDFHGGVFFDQDRDGDKDLFIVTGGGKDEVFLRNNGGTQLEDITEELNLSFVNARGRQSTCLDVNNDGLTDLLINNQRVTNPPGQESVLMLADTSAGFLKDSLLGFEVLGSTIGIISDLDGDGRTDLCVSSPDTLRIFSFGQNGAFIEEVRFFIENIGDISVADFNGDLLPDIFVARGISHATDIQQFNDSAIHASCSIKSNLANPVINFKTEGPIKVIMSTEFYSPYNLHLGSDTTISDVEGKRTFTLHPELLGGFQDPSSFPDGVQCSFGFLPDSTWNLEFAQTGQGKEAVILEILSTAPITELTSVGMPEIESNVRDMLLLNQGDFQFDASPSAAFAIDEYSVNVTSGDYDNDMDIDFLVVSSGRAKNRKTRLYENLGDGDFEVHFNGWGTKGDVAGIGDAVSSCDFDNDGFLDLFVTNGSTNNFLDSAGLDLYRNLGNENHWVKLSLQGVQSNIDGFGARVILQANGIAQVRDMTGGIHMITQDDSRLHFGLASATIVDTITVYWPSGVIDVLYNQDINTLLTIVEGETAQIDCLGVPGGTANIGTLCDDGDACTSFDQYDENCLCTGTLVDSDNDGICDADDACPMGPNPGELCNDGDISTLNDMIQDDCTCAGTPWEECPMETLYLTVTLDEFGSHNLWYLLYSNGMQVESGGPFIDGNPGTQVNLPICVPAGCYELKLIDTQGDGIVNGGYTLTEGNGARLIDATGSFDSLSFAQSPFCLPIGTNTLAAEDCDRMNISSLDSIRANAVPGATSYEFFLFDPHGSFHYSFYESTRTLHLSNADTVPRNIALNVRVRTSGPGWDSEYGPACTISLSADGPTGTDEYDLDLSAEQGQLHVWPNPTNGAQVHIAIQGIELDSKNAEVHIYNTLGSQIRPLVLSTNNGVLDADIDLESMPDGVYLIRVTVGKYNFQKPLVVKRN